MGSTLLTRYNTDVTSTSNCFTLCDNGGSAATIHHAAIATLRRRLRRMGPKTPLLHTKELKQSYVFGAEKRGSYYIPVALTTVKRWMLCQLYLDRTVLVDVALEVETCHWSVDGVRSRSLLAYPLVGSA